MSTLASVIMQGTAADMPSASIPGRLYFATDTQQTFYDTGSAWDNVTSTVDISVALSMPAEFSVSGSPVTGSGTLAVTKSNQSANEVFAGPSSGSAAAPTFRTLAPSDLPVATTSALGAVKPDGSTITISAGIISASGGGGGGTGSGGVNSQSASYTALSGDAGKDIVFDAGVGVTLTLPSAPPSSTWWIGVQNNGIAPVTISPNGLNIDGVAQNLILNPGMGANVYTDGTNYFTQRGGILTSSTTVPTYVQSNWSGAYSGTVSSTDDISPGSAIVVELMHSDASDSTPTVTDNQGNSYTLTNDQGVSGEFRILTFVALNAVGGPLTVTSEYPYSIMTVYEYAGVGSVDVYTSAQDATADVETLATGSVTTTAANDLIHVNAAQRGSTAGSFAEANGYTQILAASPTTATTLNLTSWYGIKAAAGSVSDTATYTGSEGGGTSAGIYAGILCLKPSTSSAAIIEGDVIGAGPNGALQPIHAGASGTVLMSNGTDTVPSFQTLPTSENQSANEVFAGPSSGSAAAPTFRSLVAADLPLATGSAFGAIKPDGTTCSVTAGVLTATGSGGTTVAAAAPYVEINGVYYDADFYAVTKPPTSGLTWLNSTTPGTVTSGANGNLVLQSNSSSNYFQSQSLSSYVEAVLSAVGSVNPSNFGIWVYDSTNGIIWSFFQTWASDGPALEVYKWTFSGSGAPSPSSAIFTNYGLSSWGKPVHLRLKKSGTTLDFDITLDGGATYQTLFTESSIGTLASGGIYLAPESGQMVVNVLSLAVS